MPTLMDVARAAGVSRSTVSNVFNNPDRVRAEVRERVEAAARQIGFGGPDPKGRLLQAGKFNAIGVITVGATDCTPCSRAISRNFSTAWPRFATRGAPVSR